MQNEKPPSVRRDGLAVEKAELTIDLVEVRKQIGNAKGNAFTGRPRIANHDWSDLLNREATLKAEIARVELDLVRINREASERRWQVENDARSFLRLIVKAAIALCDDDSDANWRRLEYALDLLRDKCPEYGEQHGLKG
jgi:hypothetical protein